MNFPNNVSTFRVSGTFSKLNQRKAVYEFRLRTQSLNSLSIYLVTLNNFVYWELYSWLLPKSVFFTIFLNEVESFKHQRELQRVFSALFSEFLGLIPLIFRVATGIETSNRLICGRIISRKLQEGTLEIYLGSKGLITTILMFILLISYIRWPWLWNCHLTADKHKKV